MKLTETKFGAVGEVLDKVARAAKLTAFTAFADNRPIPEDFDSDPDELAKISQSLELIDTQSPAPTDRRAGIIIS
jgi:hypothetical protein